MRCGFTKGMEDGWADKVHRCIAPFDTQLNNSFVHGLDSGTCLG